MKNTGHDVRRYKISGGELSYQKRLQVAPIEHRYGQKVIKYGCPICEAAGLLHQVQRRDSFCPNCGVNLFWE